MDDTKVGRIRKSIIDDDRRNKTKGMLEEKAREEGRRNQTQVDSWENNET